MPIVNPYEGFTTVRKFGTELEGFLGREGAIMDYGPFQIDGQSWDIGSDPSLNNSFSGYRSVEIRSPILESTVPLRKMYNIMTEQGWEGNTSSGLHIHVFARDLEPKHVKRLVGLMTEIEPIIYTITDNARYDRGYCQRMNSSDSKAQNLRKKMQKRVNRLDDINYNGYNRDGLNIGAHRYKGSIEFRYFYPQKDVTKLEKYIELVTKTVEFAKTANLEQIKVIVNRMHTATFEESCAVLQDVLGLTFDLALLRENRNYERYQKIRWVPTAEELAERAAKKAEKESAQRAAAEAPAV